MSDNEETSPAVARKANDGKARGRRLGQRAEELLQRTRTAAEGGLRAVKTRAQEPDRVGQATHRALEFTSGGLDAAGKALRQLGEATKPQVPGQGTPSAPRAARSEKSGRARPETS